MKIAVVIPTEASRRQAGVRIRYERIAEFVALNGSELRIRTLDDIAGQEYADDDVYLISKCFDARSQILAAQLRSANKIVGIDLFDDYFSQSDDSRLLRFRKWLAEIRGDLNFILCCTPRMEVVAQQVAPGVPTLVMNDPAASDSADQIAAIVDRKVERSLSTREIDVCWFGVGDNSHFAVGLSDLLAFSRRLSRLETRGYSVRLAIRTNARALSADTLARLNRLPFRYSLDEWSLDAEERILHDSLVSFLPTSGQAFSRTKSLNRALTSLCAGTQVLSAGYPLYERIASFIYRDELDFLDDLAVNRLRLRSDTSAEFSGLLKQVGSAPEEASHLLAFLAKISENTEDKPNSISQHFAIIHGQKSDIQVRDFSAKLQALTVSGPYFHNKWTTDIVTKINPNGLQLDAWVSEKALLRMAPRFAASVGSVRQINGARYRPVTLPNALSAISPVEPTMPQSVITMMSGYATVMDRVAHILETIIPGIQCITDERLVFPFAVIGNAASRRT
ncbi:hypothetical protein LQ948_02275 [Jiella sp. MQZ9-1]|uniref:Uncharacterized protein n=1 Tax=Jiella flava TaxID=2816857 RepID=A0A939FWD5_9HYPH|nr:hypothetical protein [Jiella flava]MBO0661390.1 hypothetical protein [Jiella flava]MCD2470034.1 hypothetical protein [Jiella flava]